MSEKKQLGICDSPHGGNIPHENCGHDPGRHDCLGWLPVASPQATRPEPNRCAVCGWTLAETRDKGCRPGDCSQRPLPYNAYDAERANREYANFWGTQWSRRWDEPSAAQPAAGTTPRVDQIVLERVADGSELAMSNGKGYWAFSCFVGESREGVGSADELQMAMSMAQEMLEIIESGAVSKGFKTGKVTP